VAAPARSRSAPLAPRPAARQGPEVRSGDLAEPIDLEVGQRYTFTIEEGANGKGGRISVNYDDFIRGGRGGAGRGGAGRGGAGRGGAGRGGAGRGGAGRGGAGWGSQRPRHPSVG
jgi:hypothetical protein